MSKPESKRLTRRQLLACAAGGALAAGVTRFPSNGMAQVGALRRPNVLVLLADDQTFNTVRMLGNSAIKTPNLDRLAARGTSMATCFNQGAWNGAVCMASRAMIQTGRHLFRVTDPHDVKQAGQLQTDFPLWPEHFKANGYDTFGTGKWYGDDDSIRRSFHRAPALFLGGMHPYAPKRYDGGTIETGHRQPVLRSFDGQRFEKMSPGQWSTDVFADAGIQFLKERKGQPRPFFAYVSFTAPHDPRHAPKQYADQYDPSAIELPPNVVDEHPFNFGIRDLRDEVLLDYPRQRAALQREIATYYAMITHMDARIGDLLRALDAAGQGDNTVIVFSSDHGLAMGQHGLLGKQNLYDHSVRVPMIWSGPGINPGEICEELVYVHSLYATACELAELEVPKHVDAPSLLPVMAGAGRGQASVFGAYTDTIRSVRTADYKLVVYPKLKKTQLFDLRQDPWEMQDLSGDARHNQRIQVLLDQLKARQAEAGDALRL